MTETEWRLALARMAQAAMRRIAEDQLDGLARLWHGKAWGLNPVGAARAVEAFVLDGKLPPLRDFLARARDLSPRDPVTVPPETGTCGRGHVYVLRHYTNSAGRSLGLRHYCPCMERGAVVYGESWGPEVAA